MRAGGAKCVGKIQDVAHGRGAKRVDRLRVVADHGQPAPVGLERVAGSTPAAGWCPGIRRPARGRSARRCRRRATARPSSAPSTAAGRRNRARSAAAWPRRRRRTVRAAPPPSRRTRERRCASTVVERHLGVHRARIDRQGRCPWSESASRVDDSPSSCRTRLIRSAESSRSWMVKARIEPDARRHIRAAAARRCRETCPTRSAPRRRRLGGRAPPRRCARPAAPSRRRRGARTSAAGCGADRRRASSDGRRDGPAYWSCPSRRRRSPAAARPRPAPDAVLDRAALLRIELVEIGRSSAAANHPARCRFTIHVSRFVRNDEGFDLGTPVFRYAPHGYCRASNCRRHSGACAQRTSPESRCTHGGRVWIPGSRFQRAPE